MSVSTSGLIGHIPNVDDIRACLEWRVESAKEAVLLATHQEMNFPVDGKIRTDHELLNQFLAHDPAGGTLFMAIQGNPGVGKTHAIRWLKARMEASPGASKRRVILIPKGTRLRKVLEKIRDQMKGDAAKQLTEVLEKGLTNLLGEEQVVRDFMNQFEKNLDHGNIS